jgi:hypothetical protein
VKEYRVLGPDGATPWRLALGRVYCDADGVPEFMRGLVSDITERKQSEAAIRGLNATLEQKVAERTAQLAAASAAKSQFMAHMRIRPSRQRPWPDCRQPCATNSRPPWKVWKASVSPAPSNPSLPTISPCSKR